MILAYENFVRAYGRTNPRNLQTYTVNIRPETVMAAVMNFSTADLNILRKYDRNFVHSSKSIGFCILISNIIVRNLNNMEEVILQLSCSQKNIYRRTDGQTDGHHLPLVKQDFVAAKKKSKYGRLLSAII